MRVAAPRMCQTSLSVHERLLASLAFFHERCVRTGNTLRPLAEAQAVIEDHCNGCEHFTGNDCRELMDCAHRGKWVRAYGEPTGYLPRLVGLAKPCERMVDGR